jgi:hypothetical protein
MYFQLALMFSWRFYSKEFVVRDLRISGRHQQYIGTDKRAPEATQPEKLKSCIRALEY